ncbi:peptidoglycan DD-metalloendopeptidase family protein [Pseudanabaena sp. FACHB-1998]|uniref:peptidoglycan DD-metalloendopeptidase family protein n=1 Tax=Pseudanabaena sp. FACHB-1998 TaxID=2692858 RepID=UPI001680194C|nr:peptidoglycan DD-metalloendopeptidase family protein [Pseudanabaena sp. FACHB-1998]MBD2177713.1 peptidoglycan DD-metalloendopeptidase family protein [Pseudanabaena sp. FACHB-1998]
MKKISSKDEDLMTNVSLTLGDKVSSLKVRRSLAVLGFALSAGTVGVLINQQSANNNLKATPVAASSRTLTDVMAQNQDRKYEMARTAIASGAWDNTQGVIVHEVREDETLWKLTQVYQVDAAAIAASNNISANTELQPGTKLVIPPVNGLVHKVKPGDTLEAISNYYNVPKNEIIKFTSLTSGDFLAIDQSLVIPGNVATLMQVKEGHVKRQLLAEKERLVQRLQELEGKKANATLASTNAKPNAAENAIAKQPKYLSYRVQSGDTIETIARRYGITQKSIIESNKLENPQWLELNQELKLPQERSFSNVQTIASSNNAKPLKDVPSPVNDGTSLIPAPSSNSQASNSSSPKDMGQVRVVAATPMVLPKSLVTKVAAANRVSPWDGLIQLTGSANTAISNAPAQEQSASLQTKANAVQPSLPVASEPDFKVAAALFPFAPDQLFGELGGSAKKNSSLSPTALNLPARSISAPSIPASSAAEQYSAMRSKPLEANSSQPVAEPKIQFPTKVAAVLSIPQIPRVLMSEQRGLSNSPAESVSQPAAEPTVKTSTVAVLSVPTIPANRAIEQNSNTSSKPATVLVQPAAEPNVQIPAQIAANLAPKVPSSESVELQSANTGKPNQVALLPEPEARMTSLEVKRLESEVDQLNAKVRDAEIKEAARKAEEARKLEATKIAAANLNSSPNPDRNFDASRSAIANPNDRSGVSPQLPQLTASAYLPDVQDYGLSSGFIWPADGVFTSGYGWRWGRVHQGIDIAAPIGTPILAAASGVVEYSSWNDGGYGNMIDIRHADGTITRYAHMNELYVKEGQTVSQGQTIGAMGSTGFSTGPHLHFEIRPNGGSAIDPMAFLAGVSK